MFLSKLLPAEGMYCVALALPSGGFRHFFHKTVEGADKRITSLNDAGKTVYIAQATFDTAKINEAVEYNNTAYNGKRMGERTQENAILLKNFFIDIDVGEKWPLKTKQEAMVALREFIQQTGLPVPTVVCSGNGLYAHWILETAIPSSQWKTIAGLLKKVIAAYSPALGGDSSRTSDSASVLRPPGTTNRKPGRPESYVRILVERPEIDFLDFVRRLEEAARKKKINRDIILPPKQADVNADFYEGLNTSGPLSDANKVADKCAQLKEVRDLKGNVPEPLWYNTIGLVIHCDNGDEIAQEWSSGYENYTYTETERKISQWRATGLGPTTCSKFGDINPVGCLGCPHNGKIKSPIVLGKPEPKAKELGETQCPAPEGFKRGTDGLYAAVDDQWIKFYDQDLYVDRLAYDQSLGYEVMTIKHLLPFEGELECTMRSSLVNDPKMLMTTLADNHIKIVGIRDKKFMVAYMESYQAKLQRMRRMSTYLCQMGWAKTRDGQEMFVHGRQIFHQNGETETASLAQNVPEAAKGYRTAGELSKWSDATAILDAPGMEPFAFALLSAFGAPLMEFTGFSGGIVSMVGESGAGKTLMLMFVQSVWGFHPDLMMLRNDTANSLLSRLGVYGNLPATIDEVTNMDGAIVSDLSYQITQGREKTRLDRNAVEKKNPNKWNTIAVTSSNESLVDKLSSLKADASAEINRVFEYYVNKNDIFQPPNTDDLYWTITQNFGHAGEIYAKWLVKNVRSIKNNLDKIRLKINERAATRGEERFWSAIAAVNIYGGLIAKALGLIQFDVLKVMRWTEKTISEMRTDKIGVTGDSFTLFAQFLNDHAGNQLIVRGSALSKEGCQVIENPRGPLYIRYEIDTCRLFISRPAMKSWLTRKFGSYSKVKNDLTNTRALVNPNRMKNLGAGTWHASAQQACWEVDMTCKRLGSGARAFVETAERLTALPPLPGSGKPPKDKGEGKCKM